MKANRSILQNFLLLFLLCSVLPANAQYALKNSTFSNGATISTDSTNYNLFGLTGQDVIGENDDGSYFAYAGFIYTGLPLVTGIENPFSDLPKTFELYQNYPNPFNPATNIKFALPKAAEVKIDVFNVLGQHVSTLVNTKKQAGYHVINFDANRFSSGMYFYTIQTDNFSKVKKMLLVK